MANQVTGRKANSKDSPNGGPKDGPKDGRSKNRPGVETQRQLIREAAAALFVERGSQAVSISQICQHAEISRPTFYRCYEDKEALVADLYDFSIFEPVRRIVFAQLPKLAEDEQAIGEALDAMLEAFFERSVWAELVFAESNNPGSPAYEIVNAAFDEAVQVVHLWFGQINAPPPPANFLKSVMVACQWLLQDAIRAGLTNKARQQAKDATRMLVSTLVQGLTQDPSVLD